MNEEYLWNKTGADPEIERLENALGAFRFKTGDAPPLPAKILPVEIRPRRSFFRLGLAFAACAVLAVGFFAVRFQSIRNEIDAAANLSAATGRPNNTASAGKPFAERRAEIAPVKVRGPKPAPVKSFAAPKQSGAEKIKHSAAPKNRPAAETVRGERAARPAVKLSNEEKYAYDSLMLALSITGSKLKMVKDKIEGVED